MVLFPASALEKLIEVTNEWWITASEKESMIQVTTVDPDGNVCFSQGFRLVPRLTTFRSDL
jgi:hypothetical protein